jgi:hypothetical protein
MIDPRELLMNLKQSPQPNGYYLKDIADAIEFIEDYLKEKEQEKNDNPYYSVGATFNAPPLYHRPQPCCVYSTPQSDE